MERVIAPVLTGVAVLGLAAGIVFSQLESREGFDAVPSLSAGGQEVSGQVSDSSAEASAQASSGPMPAIQAISDGVDFQAIRERFGSNQDPMIILGHGEFSDEEVDAYNELHVIPFNRIVGVDCDEVVSPDLPNTFDQICNYRRERPAHPYSDLSDEDLLSLAQQDAAAAVLMARRVKDPKQRLDLYLRATALSSKPGPLMALAERRFANPVERTVIDGKRVNRPNPGLVAQRFALERLASDLGDPRARPEKWSSMLNDSDKKLAVELADRFKDQLNQVRSDAGLAPLEVNNV